MPKNADPGRDLHRLRQRRHVEHLQRRRARLDPGGVAPGRGDLRALRRRRDHRRRRRWRRAPSRRQRHDLRHPGRVHQLQRTAVAQACASQLPRHRLRRHLRRPRPGRRRYQPAWVFTNTTMSTDDRGPGRLPRGRPHARADSTTAPPTAANTQAYYAGTRAWGPIMGSATFRAVSQFSIGEYAGANNTEDDFAVMQANGLALRADDHGGTTATADQLGPARRTPQRGDQQPHRHRHVRDRRCGAAPT